MVGLTDKQHLRVINKMELQLKEKHQAKMQEADLADLLTELTRYGRPRLSFHDTGWHAKIEMHVESACASFDISTSFKEPTPLAAVVKLKQNIEATLKKYITLK